MAVPQLKGEGYGKRVDERRLILDIHLRSLLESQVEILTVQ